MVVTDYIAAAVHPEGSCMPGGCDAGEMLG